MSATLRDCMHTVDGLHTASRLLYGPPSLARGEPVVAPRDPLGLGARSASLSHRGMPNGTRGDHASPQREALRLPVCLRAEHVEESANE